MPKFNDVLAKARNLTPAERGQLIRELHEIDRPLLVELKQCQKRDNGQFLHTFSLTNTQENLVFVMFIHWYKNANAGTRQPDQLPLFCSPQSTTALEIEFNEPETKISLEGYRLPLGEQMVIQSQYK